MSKSKQENRGGSSPLVGKHSRTRRGRELKNQIEQGEVPPVALLMLTYVPATDRVTAINLIYPNEITAGGALHILRNAEQQLIVQNVLRQIEQRKRRNSKAGRTKQGQELEA